VLRGAESLEYPSRLLAHKRPETSPVAAGDYVHTETIDWASVADDLDAVRQTRANLLVIGPAYLAMQVVRRVIADVPATICSPSDTGRLPLSRLWFPHGTLVFRDIDTLDAEGQALLFDWLEGASANRQIVSTATTCLMPKVNAGAFSRELYYRLNTIFIRLGQ